MKTAGAPHEHGLKANGPWNVPTLGPWALVLALLLSLPVLADQLDAARSLTEQHRYSPARQLLEKIPSASSREGERLLLLTQVCNGLGDYESGIAYGKKATHLLPENSS